MPGLKYRIARGPSANGFAPNINVVDEAFSGSLAKHVDASLVALKQLGLKYKLLKREPFQTDDGLPAERVTIEAEQYGRQLRQTICYVGQGKRVFVITCTALAEGGEALDETFEKSIKTFRIHE